MLTKNEKVRKKLIDSPSKYLDGSIDNQGLDERKNRLNLNLYLKLNFLLVFMKFKTQTDW